MSTATCFKQIDPLPASWRYDQRIPFGEIVIVVAPGGTGKGLWTADLAARLTRGHKLQDGGPAEPPMSVLMASVEDDPNVVTANRLLAAGADMRKVYDLSHVDGMPFELPLHMAQLQEAVRSIPDLGLVILDPLAGIAIGGLRSVERVRRVLKPLQSLANDTGIPFVLTHHTNKDGTVAGSAAVVDAVRCVMMIAKDKSDPSIKIVTVVKSNMGSDSPTPLRFKIFGDSPFTHIEYLVDASDAKPKNGQRAILAVLAQRGDVMSGSQVANEVGLPYPTVRVLLSRLADNNKIMRVQDGWFQIMPKPVSQPASVTPQVSGVTVS